MDSLLIPETRVVQTCGNAWGPTVTGEGICFRIWAPAEKNVTLRLSDDHVMTPVGDGWFEVVVEGQPFGSAYGFVLSDGRVVADPASRQQVSDVSGLSVLTDPRAYQWQDGDWLGRPWHETIIYELHIGTFTQEGTFQAAAGKLARLAELGFTAIELMPVAHFPGDRGWGYDGVLQYAPHSAYGTPDDFKVFVDLAHDLGLMVFLDVVYNHFGPVGNFLDQYAPGFFREGKENDWGAQIAFEEEPVRRLFIDNALYWLEEFHLDGLRFDAIHELKDDSKPHVIEELSTIIRARITDRHVHLVTENPPNGTDLMASGLFTADWNDAFHHVIHVIATGENTGLFEDFGDASFDKLRKVLSEGYLEAGQSIVGKPLPPSASLPPVAFVHFLQNHDQVGNRALGDRLHMTIDEQLHSVLTSTLLLSPQIPLLFMGDCFKATTAFHFSPITRARLPTPSAKIVLHRPKTSVVIPGDLQRPIFPTRMSRQPSLARNWIGARPKPSRGGSGHPGFSVCSACAAIKSFRICHLQKDTRQLC
ncbi:alpha-amylase family glycosyl hydrolase [Rhizobium sp. 32-5/1]|uniref:alpha-amylase family glycosyl hydrolase n=1 Tax=Rhizobium sp. 32-5/1 TaxID=3019602 RepID=UPI00240E0927|nr:alpha-amylase family glycosyl hydrolase [Rhizobium sp. 32-5/1]WEZ82112.1 alpha-amylase family glycosyl hydrolase [Rhizobium sp. 32-5/1]